MCMLLSVCMLFKKGFKVELVVLNVHNQRGLIST